ncbi:unnamed protein product [Tilletia caries]|nr:unnamed protein product [Tilletia caries]
MPTSARSLYTADTLLSADSIEFDPRTPGLFALGTYQVDQREEAQASSGGGKDDDDEKEKEGDGDGTKEEDRAYTRRGRLTLHQILDGKDDDSVQVQTLASFDTSAILDLKWCGAELQGSATLSRRGTSPTSSTSTSTLALADARGSIHFYSLLPPSPSTSPRLAHRAQLRLNPHDVLCLSLDWSDRRGGVPAHEVEAGETTSLIVSQSDGTLVHLPHLEREFSQPIQPGDNPPLLPRSHSSSDSDEEEEDEDEEDEMDEDDPLAPYQPSRAWEHRPRSGMEVWRAHGHEAWIAAWDCWSSGRVAWSGGDDCKLMGWDMRTPIGADRKRSPIFTVSRGFDGGVTAIQSSHLREHIWAVGSYDGHIRIFDSRSPRSPLTSLDVSGGLWRTRWHPSDPSRLLLGCMHGGFCVVRVSSGEEVELETMHVWTA